MIFDLDDTLVETTKCLSPYYLEKAYQAMCGAGLEAGSFEELKTLDAQSLSGKKALLDFCSQNGVEREILEIGLQARRSLFPEKISLDPVPGALELLESLGREACALVTMGDPSLQNKKLEKAGIQPERFCKIVVCDEAGKKGEYKKLLNESSLDPQNIVVIGDRIPFDLTPGRELGFFTIHFRNGRGRIASPLYEDVDVTIEQLNEVTKVLEKHEV